MDEIDARSRITEARVGRLATVTSTGDPHVVPCCFAVAGDTIVSAVDAKPKSTLALRRLDNLRANAAAALLVDHYDEDWSSLWWIRVDGHGRVLDGGAERDVALSLLAIKYEQYRRDPPPGPVIAIDIDRWTTWESVTRS